MLLTFTACSANEPDQPVQPIQPEEGEGSGYFDGKKVLIAYFSWGGTTERMARQIQAVTGGDFFEIEPVTPYPTSYTPCTEVALEERDSDARPAIRSSVADWDEYDIIFLGGPVWWHTAPMILHTFAESYNFEGKTVVPFTTYASTYRDETLQAIADMTPAADHLEGLGLTSGAINESRIRTWIDLINEQYGNQAAINNVEADAAESGEEKYFDLNGRAVSPDTLGRGIYIVKSGKRTAKIVR